jgi:hypothetical protein
MGSLVQFVNGRLDLGALLILQIVNPFLSALLVVILSGRRVARRFAT